MHDIPKDYHNIYHGMWDMWGGDNIANCIPLNITINAFLKARAQQELEDAMNALSDEEKAEMYKGVGNA